jgi:two-component system, chemotaxis family, chemotaxis protein CheY
MKLLLIDDEPIFHLIHEKLLINKGMVKEVRADEHAADALKFLVENTDNTEALPDVILVDLNMPVMDGFTFLKLFKTLRSKMQKKMFVCVLSSSTNSADIGRSKEAGANHYFSKPLDALSFEMAVKDYFKS